jgi:hypothetical protein
VLKWTLKILHRYRTSPAGRVVGIKPVVAVYNEKALTHWCDQYWIERLRWLLATDDPRKLTDVMLVGGDVFA